MKYLVETDLEHFEAWSGGRDTLDTLIEKGDVDSVESFIDGCFCDSDEPPTKTAINDFLWFERNFIAQHLGYDNWEEYEYGPQDEDEDEDENNDEEEE